MSEQAVSTTSETEQPNASVENEPTAQDSLDALLNEYEPASTETETTQPAQPAVSPDKMAQFEAFMASQIAKDEKSTLSDFAKSMKTSAGEVAASISDDMFEGQLHLEAYRNPKIRDIFANRDSDPEAWKNVASALGKKIAQDLSPTDRPATESWAAVDSAVHSASTSTNTTEAPKNLKKMNDQEFEAFKRGL